MLTRKRPTFSLSVIELLAKRVYYRTLARIQKMRSGSVSPETSATRNSPANRLPLKLVKMIIAYLVYDKRSLRACTMIGRYWYLAALPHLYRTLTVNILSPEQKRRWPNPITHMYRLGFLPLVEDFRVLGKLRHVEEFSPELLSRCILGKLSALTNVRNLEIQNLQIPKFMPKTKRYFRNFLPTVKSLTLRDPEGSPRQIVYFIGLFEGLQDLDLFFSSPGYSDRSTDDLTLTPAHVPPLQGWLKLTRTWGEDLLKDMIYLFKGLRFRYMYLYKVDRMQLLLEACAETLLLVVLNPTNPSAESSLQDFDLSRNKRLRTLLVKPSLINSGSRGPASRFLKHVLSTITSPGFSEVVITYGSSDFRSVESYDTNRAFFGGLSQTERAQEVARHRRSFEVLREMHEVRGFQLVLRVLLLSSVGEEPVQILEEAVGEEKVEGGFDRFSYDPFVEYYST